LLAALLLLGAMPAAASGMAGPASCRFAPPPDWPVAGVLWSGVCGAGLAQGRGTLRAYQGGRVVRSFYGDLKDGQLILGVVEVPEAGFIAGRFQGGQAVDDGERNTILLAFEAASAAARELARGFRQAGNRASARFYEAKAAQLARQMD
jgi:hypothetical protein